MSVPSLVVVEPDETEAALLRTALSSRFPRVTAIQAVSGDAALQHLTDQSPARKMHPLLLLFDVQSFDDSVHDVLSAVRRVTRLVHMPIVVFVRENAGDELDRAHALRVNSVIARPDSSEAFVDAAVRVADYRLNLNQTPGSGVDGHAT
ncbi:MAG: hypothetical protein OET44_01325 [Gammaproteobacteria bacterium]|nr:hypothetical protein [Gammaproteobacteria bacterium]